MVSPEPPVWGRDPSGLRCCVEEVTFYRSDRPELGVGEPFNRGDGTAAVFVALQHRTGIKVKVDVNRGGDPADCVLRQYERDSLASILHSNPDAPEFDPKIDFFYVHEDFGIYRRTPSMSGQVNHGPNNDASWPYWDPTWHGYSPDPPDGEWPENWVRSGDDWIGWMDEPGPMVLHQLDSRVSDRILLSVVMDFYAEVRDRTSDDVVWAGRWRATFKDDMTLNVGRRTDRGRPQGTITLLDSWPPATQKTLD